MEVETELEERLRLMKADCENAQKELESRERLACSVLSGLGNLPPLSGIK